MTSTRKKSKESNTNEVKTLGNLMQHAEMIKEAEARKHSILLYDREDDVYYMPFRNTELLKKYGVFAPYVEDMGTSRQSVESSPAMKNK